ncbi:hypothetical protein T459_01664 [Capsicum annuum]|uniref:Uncharacterized protein n=1 Tax=Capsicum annuum TaxID=4072 RepID=A0A2G3AHR3_CAPAN|nr:hypothetical protein T459_01664 [Capsicum annuum]
MMDDDTSGRDHPVHHVLGLYSETHKDATDKGEIDGDKIQNYINKREEKIDEQQQSQEDGSKKQESPHKEDMQGLNAADKEADRKDDFENEDCSDLKALEDEVDGIVTDSIQVAVDTILFGMSTPSTTKPLDVGDSNKMTESQWDLSNRQIPPDFLDAQDADDYDKEKKLKYVFDGEGLQVHSCGFDAASQRVRYASLLWHYGVEKANEGYTSDNDNPPRPRKSVIEEIDASAIVTLE